VISICFEGNELFLSFSDEELLKDWCEVFCLILNRNFSLINYDFKLTDLEEIEHSILDEYSLLVDQKEVMIKFSGENQYNDLIESFKEKISSLRNFNQKMK